MHVRGDKWYGKQNEGGLGAKERRDKFSLSFLFFSLLFFFWWNLQESLFSFHYVCCGFNLYLHLCRDVWTKSICVFMRQESCPLQNFCPYRT